MPSIHPADLERRRSRCRPVIESLRHLARETQGTCNVCGSVHNAVLADADRYGFPIRTALCTHCGLIYMADRFTPEAYADFYGSGAYRSISSEFNGARQKIAGIQLDQLEYAAHVIAAVEPYVRRRAGAQLLDVGGSTGIVARQFADHFELAATVLDPAVREVAAARELGVNGVIGSVETYQPAEKYDVVLLCRSIEHLCDLRRALERIRELLQPGGVFYCDVIDYLESCRVLGPPQVVSKVDHCYWLCQETAPVIFGALGFEIVSVNVSYEPGVVGYVLRRGEPAPAECPTSTVHQILRRIRELDADWRQLARVPHDLRHRARRMGFRFKRQVRLAARRLAAAADAIQLPEFVNLRAAIRRKLGNNT